MVSSRDESRLRAAPARLPTRSRTARVLHEQAAMARYSAEQQARGRLRERGLLADRGVLTRVVGGGVRITSK